MNVAPSSIIPGETPRSYDAGTDELHEFIPRDSSPTPSDQMSRKTHQSKGSKKLITSLKQKFSHDRTTKGNTESWCRVPTLDPPYSIAMPKISSYKHLLSTKRTVSPNNTRNISWTALGSKIPGHSLKVESFLEIGSHTRVRSHMQKAISLPGDQNHVDSLSSDDLMSGEEEENSLHFEPELVAATATKSPKKPDLASGSPLGNQQESDVGNGQTGVAANHRTNSSSEDMLRPVIVRESTFKMKETFELAAETGDIVELIELMTQMVKLKNER
jgi:hypothetical protein